ncbi:MAG: hypothetical protein CVT90_00320 [Candidatus Altiarchaeales archaeon HGW-Altiarchaeales-3]|nr:MAG: hypothetical protein CVT90_00320 [Candidatus Altiarchaeales archaeon HGW-Altiarchaeales-3]
MNSNLKNHELIIKSHKDVYDPSDDSYLLLENLPVKNRLRFFKPNENQRFSIFRNSPEFHNRDIFYNENPKILNIPKIFDFHNRKTIKKGDICLDVGCGSGILSIAMAKSGCSVVAVDINPAAIELTKRNAKLNEVEDKISARISDLFENCGDEKYDFIVFNTPYLPVNDKGILEKAWSGGENFTVIHRFLSEVDKYLNKNGKFIILISSLTKINLKEYETKFKFEKIAEKKLFFEELYVFLVIPSFC